jgi:hypothetical protein
MIATVRRASRNVKRRQSGDMCLRWTAAGCSKPSASSRKILGHTDLAKLALAVEPDVLATHAASAAPAHTPIATAVPEVAASPA